VASTDADASFSSSGFVEIAQGSTSKRQTSAVYGFGATYAITPRVLLRAEYDVHDKVGSDEMGGRFKVQSATLGGRVSVLIRSIALACAAAVALAAAQAPAATLRWSSQGDYLSADPHAQNEGLNNAINDTVFERLNARDRNLKLVPSLATLVGDAHSRRCGASTCAAASRSRRHAFTADDVAFSIERAQLPSSNFKVYALPLGKVRRIDDYTVDIETPAPSPLIHEQLNTIRIMSRAWCRKHAALKPQDFKTGEETFASRNANGTGPYTLVRREPESRPRCGAIPAGGATRKGDSRETWTRSSTDRSSRTRRAWRRSCPASSTS
jgi:hypothetical protein